MPSCAPTVTTTDPAGTPMPSSFATVSAISSWISPFVRPYWNSAVRTCSGVRPARSRWAVYAASDSAISAASNRPS